MRKSSGQATVEYVLALVLAVSSVATVGFALRRVLIGYWQSYSKSVSAACPGCQPDSKVEIR